MATSNTNTNSASLGTDTDTGNTNAKTKTNTISSSSSSSSNTNGNSNDINGSTGNGANDFVDEAKEDALLTPEELLIAKNGTGKEIQDACRKWIETFLSVYEVEDITDKDLEEDDSEEAKFEEIQKAFQSEVEEYKKVEAEEKDLLDEERVFDEGVRQAQDKRQKLGAKRDAWVEKKISVLDRMEENNAERVLWLIEMLKQNKEKLKKHRELLKFWMKIAAWRRHMVLERVRQARANQDGLIEDIGKLQEHKRNLQNENKNLKQANATTMEDCRKAQNDCRKAQNDLSQLENKRKAEVEDLQAQIKKLESEKAEIRKFFGGLTEHLGGLTEHLGGIKDKLKEFEE